MTQSITSFSPQIKSDFSHSKIVVIEPQGFYKLDAKIQNLIASFVLPTQKSIMKGHAQSDLFFYKVVIRAEKGIHNEEELESGIAERGLLCSARELRHLYLDCKDPEKRSQWLECLVELLEEEASEGAQRFLYDRYYSKVHFGPDEDFLRFIVLNTNLQYWTEFLDLFRNCVVDFDLLTFILIALRDKKGHFTVRSIPNNFDGRNIHNYARRHNITLQMAVIKNFLYTFNRFPHQEKIVIDYMSYVMAVVYSETELFDCLSLIRKISPKKADAWSEACFRYMLKNKKYPPEKTEAILEAGFRPSFAFVQEMFKNLKEKPDKIKLKMTSYLYNALSDEDKNKLKNKETMTQSVTTFYDLDVKEQLLIANYASSYCDGFINPQIESEDHFYLSVTLIAKQNLKITPPLLHEELSLGRRNFYDLTYDIQSLISSYVLPPDGYISKPHSYIDRAFCKALERVISLRRKTMLSTVENAIIKKNEDPLLFIDVMKFMKIRWIEIKEEILSNESSLERIINRVPILNFYDHEIEQISLKETLYEKCDLIDSFLLRRRRPESLLEPIQNIIKAKIPSERHYWMNCLRALLREGVRPNEETYDLALPDIPVVTELLQTDVKPDSSLVKAIILNDEHIDWQTYIDLFHKHGVKIDPLSHLLIAFRDKEGFFSSKFFSKNVTTFLRSLADKNKLPLRKVVIDYLISDLDRNFKEKVNLKNEFIILVAEYYNEQDLVDCLNLLNEISPLLYIPMFEGCLDHMINNGLSPRKIKALFSTNNDFALIIVRKYLEKLLENPIEEGLAIATIFYNALDEKSKSELEELFETIQGIYESVKSMIIKA